MKTYYTPKGYDLELETNDSGPPNDLRTLSNESQTEEIACSHDELEDFEQSSGRIRSDSDDIQTDDYFDALKRYLDHHYGLHADDEPIAPPGSVHHQQDKERAFVDKLAALQTPDEITGADFDLTSSDILAEAIKEARQLLKDRFHA